MRSTTEARATPPLRVENDVGVDVGVKPPRPKAARARPAGLRSLPAKQHAPKARPPTRHRPGLDRAAARLTSPTSPGTSPDWGLGGASIPATAPVASLYAHRRQRPRRPLRRRRLHHHPDHHVADPGLQFRIGGELERLGLPGPDVVLGPDSGHRAVADAQLASEQP